MSLSLSSDTRMIVRLIASALAIALLTACGDAATPPTKSTSSASQLTKTVNQLCPKCLATQAAGPSHLEATIVAIDPNARTTQALTLSKLQMTIQSLHADQSK